MKRLSCVLVLSSLILSGVAPALAEPVWGGNCLSCHNELVPAVLDVIGEDTTADPDESATGAPDRGTLKVFQAAAGEHRTLEVELAGLDADDTYAVQLKRFRFPGVEHGGSLTYGADCDWAQWGDPAAYYSDPAVSFRWGAGPAGFAYDVELEPVAPYDYDYYDLVFAVAGKFKATGGLFYAEEHFYLQVLPAPGDLDQDGDVDLADHATFAACMGGPGQSSPPPGCTPEDFQAADLDGDSDVDLEDSASFATHFTI